MLKKLLLRLTTLSDEKLAIALGRSSEEIAEWLNGEGKIDSDALMKAKALASERGVELE